MEKLTLKIENLFSSIIHSSDYNKLDSADQDTNRLKLQQIVYKTILIPSVQKVITELINSSREFESIKIFNVSGKYTKTEKSLKIELSYSDEHENVYVIAKIFEALEREIRNKLYQYELYVM